MSVELLRDDGAGRVELRRAGKGFHDADEPLAGLAFRCNLAFQSRDFIVAALDGFESDGDQFFVLGFHLSDFCSRRVTPAPKGGRTRQGEWLEGCEFGAETTTRLFHGR